MTEYPQLVMCPECDKHAYILISESERSMGFMTKEMGMFILKSLGVSFQSDTASKKVHQELLNSNLMNSSDVPKVEDEVLMMRIYSQDHQISLGVNETGKFRPACLDIEEWWPPVLEFRKE